MADGKGYVKSYIRQSVLSPVVYDSNGDPLLDLSSSGAVSLYGGAAELNLRADANMSDNQTQAVGTYMQNDAGTNEWWGGWYHRADDVSNGTEDSSHEWWSMVAGTASTVMQAGSDGITGYGWGNALDDYEEGTWTPAFVATGTNFSSVSYSTQNGTYKKVGSIVVAQAWLAVSALTVGSASGNLRITGLPFAAAATNWHPGPCGFADNFTTVAPVVNMVQPGTTTALLYYHGAGFNGSVTYAALKSNSECHFNFIYQV